MVPPQPHLQVSLEFNSNNEITKMIYIYEYYTDYGSTYVHSTTESVITYYAEEITQPQWVTDYIAQNPPGTNPPSNPQGGGLQQGQLPLP